ncbi:leucine-rich repeat-containing protein 74B-like [Anopheles bellator]|uniref:leucine-rich repeat-containing protein 74B-like n=1 Tax=Anopheles bellator TaxID=139047 RepID=UPI00264A071E|nr:leucine-rich repeat-containing protein 74B-like [Anopheles bellator]
MAQENDSEEFSAPTDPLSKLGTDNNRPPRQPSATEYRLRSDVYGVTGFTSVANVLSFVENNPSAQVELDFNRCGYTNLELQIALDALLQIRPTWLTAIDLSYNTPLNPALAQFLGNTLQELQTIASLALSYNPLDDECVAILSDALSNSGVCTLHANHCHITDAGGSLLFRAMIYSDCIEKIDVSWNQMERFSGQAIGAFLSHQRTISELNLSGNHLHCGIPLLKGLIGNEALTQLDLSWNGLRGEEFGRTLLKGALQSKLRQLNLEHNLLGTEEIAFITRLVSKSESLREIRLAGNFLSEAAAYDLVQAFGRNASVERLSLGEYYFINQQTAKLCQLHRKRSPHKTIVYQGVLLNNPPRPVDVQEMLLDRCRFLATKPKKRKLKRDFGHLMLQFQDLGERIIPREEFLQAVKLFRVKLDQSLIDALLEAFGVPRNLVDVGAMAVKYLTKHPTERPSEKKANAQSS